MLPYFSRQEASELPQTIRNPIKWKSKKPNVQYITKNEVKEEQNLQVVFHVLGFDRIEVNSYHDSVFNSRVMLRKERKSKLPKNEV